MKQFEALKKKCELHERENKKFSKLIESIQNHLQEKNELYDNLIQMKTKSDGILEKNQEKTIVEDYPKETSNNNFQLHISSNEEEVILNAEDNIQFSEKKVNELIAFFNDSEIAKNVVETDQKNLGQSEVQNITFPKKTQDSAEKIVVINNSSNHASPEITSSIQYH